MAEDRRSDATGGNIAGLTARECRLIAAEVKARRFDAERRAGAIRDQIRFLHDLLTAAETERAQMFDREYALIDRAQELRAKGDD